MKGFRRISASIDLVPTVCTHRFDFLPYTVNLNYQSTILRSNEEITMVIIGPFTNIFLFCIMIIWCWLMQRLFAMFPNIFSRFILAFGINTLLDPLWILIVDSALERWVCRASSQENNVDCVDTAGKRSIVRPARVWVSGCCRKRRTKAVF